MRFTKATQYGILFSFYISRGGRVTVDAAAENLKLSKNFLQQVALNLKKAKVIKSIRGPHGGYELDGDPTIWDIIEALNPTFILSSQERFYYSIGCPEERTLEHYAKNLGKIMNPILNRKIKNIVQELVVNEVAILEKADTRIES